MSEKQATVTAPKADRVPVGLIVFVEAQDLPREQKSGVTCVAEPTKERLSYLGWYVQALDGFEVHTCANGAVIGIDVIPREQVRRWKKLGDR